MSTFYRLDTDQTRTPVSLENAFAGPTRSACWLIGGGPSLNQLPCEAITRSPVPKLGINLAGTRLLRPTFWTSYDPSARFHRSVYLDPGIMKFVHRRRAMDLVPESSFKVCECPNLYFFDRDGQRGFADLLAPENRGIVDWADSMVQAIDVLYRLGFRVIYLAGCELRVRPSEEQIQKAAAAGVEYDSRALLQDFVRQCNEAGVSTAELDELPAGPHYHFDEHKPLRAAVNTDFHYFRISQYLRLSRRSLSLAGVQLISVTPGSRLNDYFPCESADDVLKRMTCEIGNPQSEPVRGLYGRTGPRQRDNFGPMRDFRPHNWSTGPQPVAKAVGENGAAQAPRADGAIVVEDEGVERPAQANGNGRPVDRRQRLAAKLDRIPGELPGPQEEG